MAYLWWGRANKGKTDHLWVDDETLCGLKTKTRHPWLHGQRRCSQCLNRFDQSAALQADYETQEVREILRRASRADAVRFTS